MSGAKGGHVAPEVQTDAPGRSPEFVPDTAPAAVLLEVALFDQRPEVLLQGVATCASQPDDVSHCDPAVPTGELDDLQRQLR